uniref:Retrovirus-related Pol polyprotein from transposon TNT 1-94 n=1 Tax=Cajanus cajan TaxID=3821 RepID=A0A151SFV5_CAJCA|nr:Retrovirus-related Pol polyprotein from transposon TNT 1-94 [Cajanus cajan]
MHKPTTEPVAFQTQSVRYNKEGTKRIDWRKKKLKCEHCQKMGHTEDKCYEIIGYPPDWGKKNKERKDNRGGPKAAQVVTTERPIPGLSMQQYERLMQQLKGDAELVVTILQSKPNMNMASKIIFTKPWVIDSGATAHITCDSALLIEERFTNQQPVKIPNGQNILVKSIGITELPNGVKVNNVLNIPDFKCNLLSVSKLTREHNCALTFVDDLCVIQDLTTRTLIGVGRHRDGLYLLEPIQDGVMEIKVDRSIDESIWHWRLGHASETKMKQIEPLSDVVSNNSFMHCDSCIRAKQTRLPFPSSSIKSNSCFDLIHCDV